MYPLRSFMAMDGKKDAAGLSHPLYYLVAIWWCLIVGLIVAPLSAAYGPVAGVIGTPAPTAISGPFGQIAFPAYNSDRRNWDLYLLNVNARAKGLIREQASQPAFSPDGRLLAFRSENPSYLGIEMLNLTTGKVVQVTRYAEDAWPTFSRDLPGVMLFSSQRQPDRRWRIYGALTDGSRDWEFAVENKPVYGTMPGAILGNRIAYVGCVRTECGIILADGDGSNGYAATQNIQDTFPVPSPDGRWLAFMPQRTESWDIDLLDLRTRAVKPLFHSPAEEGSPAWSPDGRFLAFISNAGKVWAIWMAPFDPETGRIGEPTRLLELDRLPAEGWPWLDQRIAWGG